MEKSSHEPNSSAVPDVDLSDWGALNLTSIPPDRILAALLACDPETAPVKDNLSASWACEYLIRTLTARQNHHLAHAASRQELEHPHTKSTGAEEVAAEISPRYTLTKGQARYRVSHAHDLVTDLPTILNLVTNAHLDLYRATKVDTLMREHLQPGTPHWNAVAAHVTRIAPGKTVNELTAAVRQAILAIDPVAAQNCHTRAKKARNVRVFPLPDGMGAINATVPAEDAILCNEVLDALADACRDYTAANGAPDPRTHDQRRADVHSAVWRAIAHGTPLPIVPTPVPYAESRPKVNQDKGISHWDAKPSHPEGDGEGRPGSPRNGERPEDAPLTVHHRGSENPSPEDADEPASLTEQLNREHDQRSSDLDHVMFGGTFLPPDASTDLDGAAGIRGLAQYHPGALAWWMPPHLPTRHGRRPHLVITVAASTLNGHDELPADLLGYGPVTAPHARTIAGGAGRTSTIRIPVGPHPSQAPPPAGPSSALREPRPLNRPPKDLAESESRGPSQSPGNLEDAARPRTLPEGPDLPNGSGTPEAPVPETPSSPESARLWIPKSTATWSFGGPARDGQPYEHGPGDPAPCPHPGRPYKPGQKLTDKMIRLHQRCTYAGCTARAERCDLDHLWPYADGGPTCACDLHPLCRYHHRLKTHAGWTTRYTHADEPHPAGTVHWTSPNGLEHDSPPPVQPGSNGWQPPQLVPSDPAAAPTEPEQDDDLSPDTTTARARRVERRRLWNHAQARIARKDLALNENWYESAPGPISTGDPGKPSPMTAADLEPPADPEPSADPEPLALRDRLRFLTRRSPFFTRPGLADLTARPRARPPLINGGEPPF
jgi:hypothetical protein